MFTQHEMVEFLYESCIDNEYMEAEEVTTAEMMLSEAITKIDSGALDGGSPMELLISGYGLACEKAGFLWGAKCALALTGKVGE